VWTDRRSGGADTAVAMGNGAATMMQMESKCEAVDVWMDRSSGGANDTAAMGNRVATQIWTECWCDAAGKGWGVRLGQPQIWWKCRGSRSTTITIRVFECVALGVK
jgi:hypothetical protein